MLIQRLALISLIFAVLAAPASAADITGVWKAQTRGAHVEISRCGEFFCGKVLFATPAKSNPQLLDVNNKDPALRGRRMIGSTLMEGFHGGPEKWTGGHLYNPGDGNTYRGVITLLDADHLVLKGCALIILCKSQVWTRMERPKS